MTSQDSSVVPAGSLPLLVQLLKVALVVGNQDGAKLRGGFEGRRIVKRSGPAGLRRINREARRLELAAIEDLARFSSRYRETIATRKGFLRGLFIGPLVSRDALSGSLAHVLRHVFEVARGGAVALAQGTHLVRMVKGVGQGLVDLSERKIVLLGQLLRI